jgi:hypothetical protein
MAGVINNFDERNYTNDFIKGLYNEQYHTNHWEIFRPRNLNAARVIYETIGFESVADFGCSIGTYLEYFISQGCDVRGYEYCYDECVPHIQKVEGLKEAITFGDVTKKITFDKKYDIAISTEVAEHIPTSKSDIFIDNLCEASSKYVCLTAAKEGQGGTGHINCQPKSFWVNKFNERGWTRNEELEAKVKGNMKPIYANDGNNEFPIVWKFIYDNIMIFQK